MPDWLLTHIKSTETRCLVSRSLRTNCGLGFNHSSWKTWNHWKHERGTCLTKDCQVGDGSYISNPLNWDVRIHELTIAYPISWLAFCIFQQFPHSMSRWQFRCRSKVKCSPPSLHRLLRQRSRNMLLYWAIQIGPPFRDIPGDDGRMEGVGHRPQATKTWCFFFLKGIFF